MAAPPHDAGRGETKYDEDVHDLAGRLRGLGEEEEEEEDGDDDHMNYDDDNDNDRTGDGSDEQSGPASSAGPAPRSAVSDLIFSSGQANHQFNHILTALKRANLSMHNRLRSIQADALFVRDVQRAYYFNPSSSSLPSSPEPSGGAASPGSETVVPRALPRPLIANERCGSWYIPPRLKRGSAYFKSTDGHHGIWAFSTRRLNLHLLRLVGVNDGVIIVDSTRRGKRMPDALSKTVPMWCAVVNSVLFPEGVARRGRERRLEEKEDGEAQQQQKQQSASLEACYEPHRLYTPPNAVSASEHAQMEARVPQHAASLMRLGLDLAPYRAALRKPLRPVWVTQESHLDIPEDDDGDDSAADVAGGRARGVTVFEDFHPVICCTSSRRVVGGEMSEGGYIQGAGDDTENWAFGLTPPVFWANADLLLSTPETELPDLVKSLVDKASAAPTPGVEPGSAGAEEAAPSSSSPASLAASVLSRYQQVAPGILVARTADLDPRLASPDGGSLCTIVINQSSTTDPSTWAKSLAHMEVGLGGKQSKIASRNLRAALPQIAEFVRAFLERRLSVPYPAATTTAVAADGTDSSKGGDAEDKGEPQILIACDTGRDLSVGLALALVCQHCTAAAATATTEGSGLTFRPRGDTDGVNKTLIKSRLGHIMTLFPDGNPSRATLQSVNSYLMG
ncbi:initiator tRNA phosphoribosyl transferase-domain-containing protein [Microdochium bolleyi]|uniref:Initiator tRNA phosphoribosyl transferase-domain-containing protein n=1 Tax=Microdochium bolleyi TaxID=196109 RepID=A0A136J742_9PEZI|nr:initiator tRNA phosphoribosyl transferase-domain-containing protein [Microdochium bolleyi]